MESSKSIHTIVLDAGPILKNDPPVSTLLAQSEAVVTVPAVLAEIRDPAARSRVETTLTPFLTLRTPKPESIKLITAFARRTGDYEVLSAPDVQILALAYELECERNGGDWRLRKVPGQKRVNGPPPEKAEDAVEATSEDSPDISNGLSESTDPIAADTEISEDPNMAPEISAGEGDDVEHPILTTESHDELSQAVEEIHLSSTDAATSPPPDTTSTETLQPTPDDPAQDSDSSDGGWITPSNIKKHQHHSQSSPSSTTPPVPKTLQVATLTTDFAMQNVLLQMNLNLLSPSLTRIAHLKTHILRCHACFQLTRDMSRQFCGRCGKPSLMRVSCSTNASTGAFKIHLKRQMQWNHRGDRFSIPKPVSGSANGRVNVGGGGKGAGKGGWGQELILVEDQKEYVRALTGQRRERERDLMDRDYLPGILTGERGRAGGRPKVGAGRNVNSKRRQ
ncbi:MAG: Nin1 binding protein [Caeruleum heppii]|nr:MAG: Nin1 binding protein [Caeruleum heppii]